jgi:Domain of unknown function (DUF4251)
MKFELQIINIITMKKTTILLSAVFLFLACSSTKEPSSTRAENRKLKKQEERAEVKKAIESRRFVIRVNRLYSMGGGRWELIPTSNFVIVNGEITSISLGYMGRSFASRPISGINLNGHTVNYKMVSNEAKGIYNIEMAVTTGGDKFDLYMTIGNDGYCSISINNANIQSVSYSGTLGPIPDSGNLPTNKKNRM